MPELIDGELLERVMGQRSDAIAATVIYLDLCFAREHDLGLVNGGQGSFQIFPDDPDKVRIPGPSFTRKTRLPNRQPAQGHARVALDLVVEVTSPNDSFKKLKKIINDFLAVGISLIWVPNPDTQTVQVFRRDGTGRRLQIGDVIEGEDVLPGFRCDVAALFE